MQSKNNRNLFPAFFSSVFLSFLLTVFLAFPASANEPSSTNPQQLKFEAGLDSNRTLGDRVMLWGQYQIPFNDNWQLHTGFSYNTTTKLINALFVELGYQETHDNTFGVRLKFLGNQYGEYGKAANSIIAYVNWDNSVYFIDFGVNYRFLNTNEAQLWNIFYYDNTSKESTYYYSFRRRFVMNQGKYRLDIDCNNQDPMYAGNLGAYGLFLKNRFTVNDKVAILGSIGFRQTGSIGLSATYYKTMVFWGVEVVL
jgi:hypothetical protein